MIIYTPLGMESIFPPDEKDWNNKKQVPIENGTVMIEKADDFTWRVVALNSSNPNDYMLPQYQPGTTWTGGQ
ncbi:YlzJ-like protein [Alteribacillus persepolensis]|uniref:YlzJ-like protein n=1 Tax=Alteribacillus persepolensis TaxID=568899 RepID=A0A1G7YTX4_9BACI|nr:YlzJ-like family protein [Alteribacillus persepolensis]SDG99827.1 YlzJ-like protein [Alteribacillus persepolensis]